MTPLIRNLLLLVGIFGAVPAFACKHVGNKTTFNDRRCSQYGVDTSGCNAGGQGRNCRYCGFDGFPDCPTPPPVVLNDSILLGKPLSRKCSYVHVRISPSVWRILFQARRPKRLQFVSPLRRSSYNGRPYTASPIRHSGTRPRVLRSPMP